MIIADLLNISITLVFALQIIVSLLLLGIVLMQRPKQEGLGAAFGGALTDQAFGARTTDVLQKGTVYLGSFFMILSFALTLLLVHRNDAEKSRLLTPKGSTAEQVVAPAVAPKTQSEILQELEKQAPAKQETPEAPAQQAQPETKVPELPAEPAK